MWKKKKCAEIFKKLICGRKRNIWLCWVLGLPRCAGAVVGWLGVLHLLGHHLAWAVVCWLVTLAMLHILDHDLAGAWLCLLWGLHRWVAAGVG